MIILLLVVVMRFTKKSSGKSSVIDTVTGGDIEKHLLQIIKMPYLTEK